MKLEFKNLNEEDQHAVVHEYLQQMHASIGVSCRGGYVEITPVDVAGYLRRLESRLVRLAVKLSEQE